MCHLFGIFWFNSSIRAEGCPIWRSPDWRAVGVVYIPQILMGSATITVTPPVAKDHLGQRFVCVKELVRTEGNTLNEFDAGVKFSPPARLPVDSVHPPVMFHVHVRTIVREPD
jgi:hypothetical protein